MLFCSLLEEVYAHSIPNSSLHTFKEDKRTFQLEYLYTYIILDILLTLFFSQYKIQGGSNQTYFSKVKVGPYIYKTFLVKHIFNYVSKFYSQSSSSLFIDWFPKKWFEALRITVISTTTCEWQLLSCMYQQSVAATAMLPWDLWSLSDRLGGG